MPINKITGVMLENDLLRDGSNLAVETQLLYIDVANNRIGVNTATPSESMDVIGPLKVNGLVIDNNTLLNQDATGFVFDLEQEDINVTLSKIVNLTDPTELQDAATKKYVDDLITGIAYDRIVSGNSELVILDTGTSTSLDLTKDSGATSIFSVTDTSAVLDVPLTSTGDLNLETSPNNNIIVTVPGTGLISIQSSTAITIPVGTSAERPFGPEQGAIRFNQDLNNPEVFDGINWTLFTTSFASFAYQEIIPNGSGVAYQLDREATSESILVSLNGVLQTPDDSYTVSGVTITFVAAPLVTDIISIRFITNLTAISAITDAVGTTLVRAENGEVHMEVAGERIITLNDDVLIEPYAIDGIVSIDATSSLTIPAGTTAERPTVPEQGAIRFNYDTDEPELFDGSSWRNFSDASALTSKITDSLQTTTVETITGEVTVDVSGTRQLSITPTEVQLSTNITPTSDETLNLGTSSNKFNNLYVGLINGLIPGTYGPDSRIDSGQY